MRRSLIFLSLWAAACGFCGQVHLVNAGVLIEAGDTWRYFKGRSSTPPLQNGRNWTQAGYDDATGWGEGPSGFGYGDADDATRLDDMRDQYGALFIRKTFTIGDPDPDALTHLTLAADYDDGFVAYVNGTEVVRRALPPGPIDHTTSALANHEASRGLRQDGDVNPQEREYVAIDPRVLVPGANVLAVSGHNVSVESTDFSLLVELSSAVNLTRGPFLQQPSQDGVTVVWHTDALSDSAVDYGLDRRYAAGTASDAALVRAHAVTLIGLAPGTEYLYRIRSGGVTLHEGQVLRSPSAPDQPYRFAVIGDFGYRQSATKTIADRVATARPDWLMTVGDNIYPDGQPGDYDAFWFRPYAAAMARAPTFPALGNHDVGAANGRWFVEYFHLPGNGPPGLEERNYSFDYGNAHVAVIDSNPFHEQDSAAMDAIAAWLSDDLASTTQPWRFAALHHPAHTSRGPHDDEAAVKSRLAPIFERAGVQLVFQGHNHWYERLNPVNGVYYVTTGAGGRSLYPIRDRKPYSARLVDDLYSFTLVDIDGTALILKAIDENGSQIDRFQLDLAHPFKMDGLLDDPGWKRASHGLNLYAAIRGSTLYLATEDAGEGSDHFIFVNTERASLHQASWAKAGQVMAWSAFLADENDNGFHGWFGPDEEGLTDPRAYRSVTSGLNSNGRHGNGVLEGTIDLVAHFGHLPRKIFVAVAPYDTRTAGPLVPIAQAPQGNGNGDIEPAEFLELDTEAIALD